MVGAQNSPTLCLKDTQLVVSARSQSAPRHSALFVADITRVLPSAGIYVMSTGVIYRIVCPEGRSYIGKTTRGLKKRIGEHRRDSSQCRAIRDAFMKHGDNMRVEVLVKCKEDDLDANETLYIEILDTVYPRGYNLRCGSYVLRGGSNALSTFVREPVVYENDEEEESVKNAVLEDLNDITSVPGIKPWAGVVKMSVKELNTARGAKQFSSWTGPVKRDANRRMEETYSLMLKVTDAESESRLVVANTRKEKALKEKEHNEENIRKRKAVDDELEDYRLKTGKNRLKTVKKIETIAYKTVKKIETIAYKIKKMEELGMTAEASKLKEELVKL